MLSVHTPWCTYCHSCAMVPTPWCRCCAARAIVLVLWCPSRSACDPHAVIPGARHAAWNCPPFPCAGKVAPPPGDTSLDGTVHPPLSPGRKAPRCAANPGMACPAPHRASIHPSQMGTGMEPRFAVPRFPLPANAPLPGRVVWGGPGAGNTPVPAAPRRGRLLPGLRGFTSPGWKGPKNRLCCQIPGRKCPENSLVCGIAACLCFPARQMKNNRGKS